MGPRDANLKKGLEAALESDTFSSALYQKMLRTLDEKDKTAYKKLKTEEDKKQFNMEWARRKLESLTTSKSHERSWRKITSTIGEYKTVEKVAERFGWHANPVKAAQSACTYALRCAQLGGKWTRFDEMSQTWMVLDVRTQYQDVFEESWRLLELSKGKEKEVRNRKIYDW